MSRRAFFGWAGSDLSSQQPLVYQGDGSLVTIARPGSGKSRSVILPNLLLLEGSVVVWDIKGELTRATALWRQQMLGQKVIVFDPFRIVEDRYLPKEWVDVASPEPPEETPGETEPIEEPQQSTEPESVEESAAQAEEEEAQLEREGF